MSPAKRELTVLMGWHKENDPEKIKVYEANRLSFIRHNPDVDVITIMNTEEDTGYAWLSTDIGMFKWYRDHGRMQASRRYLIVEWDCWCNCDLQQYFEKVWDCDLVGPCVRYPERDVWLWFKHIPHLPEKVRPFAAGIVPFSGILLSDHAMQKISWEILKPVYKGLNSEMRLATLAAFLGIEPVVNPVNNRSLTWVELKNIDPAVPALYHPVKKMFPAHQYQSGIQ